MTEARDTTSLFVSYAGMEGKSGVPFPNGSGPNSRKLWHIPRPALLALEMAAHEESERRAMEGELALLQDEWRRADEIASISDDLLLSDQMSEKLAALKTPAKD